MACMERDGGADSMRDDVGGKTCTGSYYQLHSISRESLPLSLREPLSTTTQ